MFIDHMVNNYGRDPVVTKLMNTTRIHVLPALNPDGYEEAVEGRCDGVRGRYVL